LEREVQGRVGIISRGIQGSCYRLCFSKMKPRLKHEATKELRQISTSNSICLHRFVSGFDSCWTYRLHASHDYRKFFKTFVFLASPKNSGCYSPPSLQESRPRDLGVSVTREVGSSLSSHIHQCICFAVGVVNRSFWKELFAYGFLNGELYFINEEEIF